MKKALTIALKLSVWLIIAFVLYVVVVEALYAVLHVPEDAFFESVFFDEVYVGFFVAEGIVGITVIVCIFLGVEPEDFSKTEKPDKVVIPFKSYSALKAHIETLTAEWKYTYSYTQPLDEGEISIYIHSNGLSGIDCIVLVRVPELHQENRDGIDETIYDLLAAYYGKETLNDFISMIEFFCVDRVTSSFHSTLNHVKWKDYKFEYFPVGVSFGGKNAYIAVPGKRKKRYENMREVMLRLLGIKVEEEPA